MSVHVKRIYEPFSKDDGFRILVDRLWPRGMKKEDAHLDKWLKEVAPSTELRQWFHNDNGTDKWERFVKAYRKELKESTAVEELRSYIKEHQVVTLLFAVKDDEHNHALVLREFIKES